VVTNGGNVGIGTSSPWRNFSVAGTAAFKGLVNDSTGFYVCVNTTSGQLATSTTACGGSSIRFKENVTDLSYGLDALLNLRPVSFDYKQDYMKNARRQVGFIAEEVASVTPEVVAYDEGGQIQGLDYPKFSAIIVKAVQDLVKKLQKLVVNSLTAEMVYTREIEADKIKLKGDFCVDDVCLTKDQFKEMMLRSGVGAVQTVIGTPSPTISENPVENATTTEPVQAETASTLNSSTTPEVATSTEPTN
jgi:hypothetical protein